MSFKSVLKKFGEIALTAESQIPGWGMLGKTALTMIGDTKDGAKIDAVTTVAIDKLDQLEGVVKDVELFGQALSLPGAQKAVAAAPAAMQILMDMPMVRGKKPKDPARTKEIAGQIAGLIAEFANQYEA